MTFPLTKPRGLVLVPPPKGGGRLEAVWSRDPRTGRLTQSWREADDGKRSCSVRPRGPRMPGPAEARPRAA